MCVFMIIPISSITMTIPLHTKMVRIAVTYDSIYIFVSYYDGLEGQI